MLSAVSKQREAGKHHVNLGKVSELHEICSLCYYPINKRTENRVVIIVTVRLYQKKKKVMDKGMQMTEVICYQFTKIYCYILS